MSDAEDVDVIATFKIAGHGDHHMRGPVTIGRDPRADEGATIEVDGDPLVSKSHLSIDIDQGDLIITDLGSSNGTYLHHSTGETAVPSDRWIPIPAGSEIEFGDQRMSIERAAPADETVAPVSDSFWVAEPDEEFDEPTVAPATDSTPVRAAAPPAGEHIDCARCDRELPLGSKFCDGCGSPVMPDVESTSVADDPGRTVVIPPGGFVATPAPQYGPPPAGPPPRQYGQSPPPPGAPGPGTPPQPFGGLVFVDPTAAPSSRGGAGMKVLLGVGALVGVGVIGVGLLAVLGGGDDSTAGGRGDAPTIPTELDELWSADVNGASGFAAVTDTAVYIASGRDGDSLFTSLAREDGDENWETTIDDAALGSFVGEFGDVAVVSTCEFNADGVACLAIGLDIDDGDEIWREPAGDGGAFTRAGRLFGDDRAGLILFDPSTGERLERVRGERVPGDVRFSDFNALLLRDDDEVSAYDDDLRSLIGPVEVDSGASSVAFDGERFVVGIGDEIEYVDAAGDTTPGPFLDGDITRLVAIDGTTLVAELGDEVVVYDLEEDDAVERWSADGSIREIASPAGGLVVIIDTGAEHLIVDLASGAERFDVDGSFEEGFMTLSAANAFVVVDRADVGSDVTVTAHDWTTGDEIWSEDFEGAVRVDEVVVVVEMDGNVIVLG